MAGAAAEPFAARYSIPKLLGWSLAASAMAAGSLAVATGAIGGPGVIEIAAGAVGTVFFGSIAAVFAARLFDRRTQVEIDQRGLFVRAHGDTRIGLRSIRGLMTDMGRISFTLHKPSKYPIQRWHRRLIYRANGSAARGFFGDVWIWTNQLDQPASAVMAAFDAHRPKTAHEEHIAAILATWDSPAAPQ